MRNQRRSSHLAVLLGSALVLAIVVALAAGVWVARKQAIASWRVQMSNLSLVLSEQTSQELGSACLILDSIAEGVRRADIGDAAQLRDKMGQESVFLSMRDKIQALPQIDVATIVGVNGDVVNFTRAFPAPPINLADRDYFAAHIANPQLGVFISKPVRNKGNGQWTFYLSRRLSGRHGEFVGMALVGLSSTFLSSFYEKISLGEGAAVSMYRRDFTLLARWPHVDHLMGQVNRGGSSFQAIELDKKQHDVLITDTPNFARGGRAVLRMGAPRLLEHYPVIVNITVTDDLFLAQWRQFSLLLCAVAGACVLAVTVAFKVLVDQLRRREDSMAATEKLKLEAEAASLAKSEFLAMMSHEIRTPLTAIIGFAEMLGGASDKAVRSDAAQVIVRNSEHLLHIINDILDISKIEAERLHLEHVAFSPIETVWGLDAMMSAQASSKGIAFRMAIEYPFPSLLMGDPTRWKQVLFNLCSNAVKFTELGSVELTLWYDPAPGRLVCNVVDTGIGISPAQREKLFAPFVQADSAVARKYGGTGLGLHLVKRLAEKMGGAVQVASALGKGSVFEVSVAAAPAPGMQWLASAPIVEVAASVRDKAGMQLDGHVLLAEDGPDNRKLICAYLAALGLTVAVAEDGERAVALALAQRYDLILMDIQMPVMDGMRATDLIRAAGYEGPIVALTANVMAEDVQRYLGAGFSHCVGKPIARGELAQLLARLLGRSGDVGKAGAPAGAALSDDGEHAQAAAGATRAGAHGFGAAHTGALAVAGATGGGSDDNDDFEDDFGDEENALGNLPEYAELQRIFEQRLPAQMAQLRADLDAGAWPALGALAHMLKGSAGSFGHPVLGQLAGDVERAARDGDAAQASAAVHALLAQAASVAVARSA